MILGGIEGVEVGDDECRHSLEFVHRVGLNWIDDGGDGMIGLALSRGGSGGESLPRQQIADGSHLPYRPPQQPSCQYVLECVATLATPFQLQQLTCCSDWTGNSTNLILRRQHSRQGILGGLAPVSSGIRV